MKSRTIVAGYSVVTPQAIISETLNEIFNFGFNTEGWLFLFSLDTY